MSQSRHGLVCTNGGENGERVHEGAAEGPDPYTWSIPCVAASNTSDNIVLKPGTGDSQEIGNYPPLDLLPIMHISVRKHEDLTFTESGHRTLGQNSI